MSGSQNEYRQAWHVKESKGSQSEKSAGDEVKEVNRARLSIGSCRLLQEIELPIQRRAITGKGHAQI